MGKSQRQKRIDNNEWIDESATDIIVFLKLGAEEERQLQDQRKRLGRWLRKHRKAT